LQGYFSYNEITQNMYFIAAFILFYCTRNHSLCIKTFNMLYTKVPPNHADVPSHAAFILFEAQ